MFCLLEQISVKEEIFCVPAESTEGLLSPLFKTAFDILFETMIQNCIILCFVYTEILYMYVIYKFI
jgi:hypothetical protein